MQHLNKQSVYVYVNKFSMEKTSSPDFIGQIHHKLINLKSLKVALEVGMHSAKCDKERAVSEWKKRYQNKQDLLNTIPHFKVYIQNKRWQDYHKRIEGYHYMEGEEAYRAQLRAHNKYVQSITAVTIVGMHPDAL
eukprot:10445472-Ditylum_brightwellii.AAC.1